ncbi:MAG: general secretion pathway protein GspK [Gemmatimonadota bacterium]|nr:general secretion pathway protein GspK [Gemmatimonadota bacterium]MDH3367486.1 general secretion pathway protein GspK [Gemmatimonadota bacterium]MDH3477458.1 general secretion pathway protein GspK [Gemmatimonadota bacterium]MDH3569415.1 general secretion pathway protein GspK [Gemmatimonadota bacterium]MDH5549251.1 general secretion pathway protein GspK [Gemmatimonadota bacterium]
MRYRRANGFALVAVLWILVVMGVVGVTFHVGARADRRAVANARTESRSRWAGRAGLALALRQIDNMLHQSGAAFGLQASGDTVLPPIEFSLEGVTVSALVLDARARVNLNLASDRQLTRLAEAVGLSSAAATALAASVLDWRDADGLRRTDGAEARDYAGLRPPSRPKNAPFYSVEELHTVWGVNPPDYARIAPLVTVVGDGRVNVNAAPRTVLVTVPGIDDAAAAAIVARRRAGPFRNVFELLQSLPRQSREQVERDVGTFVDRVAFGPRVVEIVVTTRAQGSLLSSRLHAVVELAGGSAWRVVRVVQS